MYEIKTELLIICDAFNLGTYIESVFHHEAGEYIQTEFRTTKGQFTHYFRAIKL